MSTDQFCAAPTVLRSTLYCLIVIGEAVRSLPDSLKERFPQVKWKEAQAMRNFAAHVYFAVDPGRIWETVTVHLPLLEGQIQQVLDAVQ